MAVNDCPRLGKWIGACRFEARYSYPTFSPDLSLPAFQLTELYSDDMTWAENMASINRPRVYEGDVCVRCGKRASRDTPAPQDEAPLSQAKPVQEPPP